MSVQEHNPFKIGDKVKVIPESMEDLSEYFKEYNHHSFAVVSWVDDTLVGTNLDRDGSHYTHYELYKEEKDMNQQEQQKTKRIPFTHELWEKWKDKGVVVTTMNGKVLEQFTYFNLPDTRIYAGVYDGLVGNYYPHHLLLEIPVTTKRIPFNPELKEKAKVFYGKVELTEWVQMKSGVVCGSHDSGSFAGVITNLYHPNDLKMEIEED